MRNSVPDISSSSDPKLFSKLALKIIAAVSLSVLVIQFAFIGYVENSIYQSELKNVHEQQIRFTEANAIYIAELASEDNEDSLYLILSAIVANPLIVGATLDYSDSRAPLLLGDSRAGLSYSFDILDLGENDEFVSVATLTTFATTSLIDEARSARNSNLLVLVLIVFLVVLSVSIIAVQLFVGIPLRRIISAIDSNGSVPKILWNSTDEMGKVVQRLNYLHAEFNDKLNGLRQELSENERREAARITCLANASLEGILIFSDNDVLELNQPMADLLGTEMENVAGAALGQVFRAELLEFLRQPIADGQRHELETFIIGDELGSFPVEIYLSLLEGDTDGSRVAVVRDISERVQTEKAMWRLAHYDSLTGLPNRRFFAESLDRAIIQAQIKKQTISVAYLDLDNFKLVNDSRGHAVGDQLLCAVADALTDVLGSTENCARLGGDEFAILLCEKDLKVPLETVLNEVLNGIMGSEACRPWSHIFSVSIGAATLCGEELTRDELLVRADLALYKAKDNGRARVCFYSSEIDGDLKRDRLLVERLVHALDNDGLDLQYQAQVLCDTAALTGFEALLRWQDPVLGTVLPEEIVAIAEREGLVAQLGRWVMERACSDAIQWPGELNLAINLSPSELANEELLGFVDQCLRKTGFPADRLEIEITETALVTDAEKTHKVIFALKAMGITIALDDFGTGYSSLSMLQDFPFDRIKIDRSFVSNIGTETDKTAIVATVVDLGKRLGLEVLAEGVETQNDLAMLQQLECNQCQGYLISKPLPVEQLPALISQHFRTDKRADVVNMADWRRAS